MNIDVKAENLLEDDELLHSRNFKSLFSTFDKHTMSRLTEVYSNDVHFQDPIVITNDLNALKRHFESSLSGLVHCSFLFDHDFGGMTQKCYQWRMKFAHQKIRGGADLELHGTSIVKFDSHGKVIYHRDYYDMGEMLYEHLPLFGGVIGFLKKRMTR